MRQKSMLRYHLAWIFVACFSVLLTGSRSALLLLIACLAVEAIKMSIKHIAMLSALLVPTIFALFANTVIETVSSIAQRMMARDSRFILWEKVIAQPEFPSIFGSGTKESLKIAGNFLHNDFLSIFFEYGYLGFIAYISIFIWIISNCLKFNIINSSILLLMSTLFSIFVQPIFWIYIFLFWVAGKRKMEASGG